MRIESLADKPDRSGKYLVRFDEGTVMRLYRQTVEDFRLIPGLELTEAQMDALWEQAGEMSAKMRAVRIVTASSVSKGDLEQRLIRKGENPAQAKAAVAWMEELNLVDDRQTAHQVVEHCIARGYGLARAKQSLYEKRIPREYWEDALADYPDQEEKILVFLRSRLRGSTDQKEIKRAADALLRRGHSWNTIRRCLNRLGQDEYPEELF